MIEFDYRGREGVMRILTMMMNAAGGKGGECKYEMSGLCANWKDQVLINLKFCQNLVKKYCDCLSSYDLLGHFHLPNVMNCDYSFSLVENSLLFVSR